MKWRCANDMFGYCNGKPDFEVEPDQPWKHRGDFNYYGSKCKLSSATCGQYSTFSQQTQNMQFSSGKVVPVKNKGGK